MKCKIILSRYPSVKSVQYQSKSWQAFLLRSQYDECIIYMDMHIDSQTLLKNRRLILFDFRIYLKLYVMNSVVGKNGHEPDGSGAHL